jgi:hypothetical protein
MRQGGDWVAGNQRTKGRDAVFDLRCEPGPSPTGGDESNYGRATKLTVTRIGTSTFVQFRIVESNSH